MKKKVQGKFKNIFNWIEIKIHQNLWDTNKAVLREKLMTLNDYNRKNIFSKQLFYLSA